MAATADRLAAWSGLQRVEVLRAIRQIIGQHHAHLIPKGLPGAGNLLVFDNGGSSGYGFNTPIAPDGFGAFARATSRVLEINPVTLELVWSYTNPRFFSTNISGAQRLPNGNTLITAGAGGRLFEVTKEGAIVWGPCFRCLPALAESVECSVSGVSRPVRLDSPVEEAERAARDTAAAW